MSSTFLEHQAAPKHIYHRLVETRILTSSTHLPDTELVSIFFLVVSVESAAALQVVSRPNLLVWQAASTGRNEEENMHCGGNSKKTL
jgi:hypothetical protein